MTLTRLALGNPVATLVAVLAAALFGAISLSRLPIQLTPEVEQPEITVRTSWRAAAPEEVEAEIIEPQEKVLRGLPGMTEMLSQAQRGQGEISVKFAVGTDLERSLIEVLNRLNRVPSYPADADEPVLSTVGGRSRAIAWFIFKTVAGNDRDIQSYQDFLEEVVQTRFERVPGVALSEVRGGREREVRITFDPYRAASLNVQLPLAARVAGRNEDVSAGTADVGKRRYTVRFAGQFQVGELGDLVLDWRDGYPILLRDIADIDVRLVDRDSFVITKGRPAMAVNAHRETGVNVLQVMKGLQAAVDELAQGPLKRAGLSVEQVYDETIYIYRSIEMLRNNLALGVLLAVAVLWWFLRRLRATLMVAASIPLCLFAAFVVLDASGHTLNVISLAGLAFAVGMVLDAAIVVLENIVRLREGGAAADRGALEGPTQVWGALLASTATTVAIFLPVVFLEDEAGQLFADLAITIAAAIIASLVIALSVVPTAARQWLARLHMEDPHKGWWQNGTRLVMALTDTPLRRSVIIGGLIAGSASLSYALIPKADYLPEGNRNLVFAFVQPPPGFNIDHMEKEMGRVIAARMEPYLNGGKQPRMQHYFFVAFPRGVFLGARAADDERAGELITVINQAVRGFPDTLAFARRASLFGGFGEGRNIDVNIQARDLEALLNAGRVGYGTITRMMPGATVRPLPGLELAEPELRLVPVERRVAEAGWNRETMAEVARALGDGLFVGEYFDGETTLDIIVRVQPWATPEDLGAIPLATPNGAVLPVNELTQIVRTAGPDQIRRLDRRRTVTLQVTPPGKMSLEEGLKLLKQKVEPILMSQLPEDGAVRYSGTADKLQQALAEMAGSFLLAVVILYLLMSALFRSFRDSLLAVLALPLATVGGVVALWLVNKVTFQPMDLLTMIGFIILLGLVVNNAILLVHQTRAAEREGMPRREAVQQAVGYRLRPILMSTLTSIFGMLPLLLVPGAGTELYRGLAAVIVGGMSVSTLFTLLLLPSLLRIGEGKSNRAPAT
ncbi:MAG: efflux RND transporter permease subunit [Gammaproteobacteria bacterium]|nr:efflux RND transporter permease subunit [Gammaproteobacteria bacterium]NIR84935.1 efflux RND transporter permease subunit [Gammaproteobacteria bacterium]NIR91784.1 efflux RND transporter permease subunit [Gammaproteobacteria bacterium]NIU05982.1 efflux RND transporter permease subunit [Gammaproteobacteria bacterium]NIV53029.1 MMPL family transporter [Gammaproteobacteria bacterium]